MRAVQLTEFGGPEVLRVADLPVPEPGPGELLIRVARAGLNFGDTHQRRNQYIAKHELPLVLGGEVAGVVERVGPPERSMSDSDVQAMQSPHRASVAPVFEPGERVIALLRTGGYAEYAVAAAARTFPIPDGVSDDDALALLIQGLTAWHLWRTSAHLVEGESVVVHSAAGGVGSLLTQLAKPMGAGRVIATAGSSERRTEALELGADVAVDPVTDDGEPRPDDEAPGGEADVGGDGAGPLTAALIEANDGAPVDVVLDAAGGRVFEQSLAALAPFGRIVAYGNSTREKVAVTNGELLKGSRSVVGFWLMHLLDRRDMLEQPLADLFARAARGELRPRVGGTYPLADAARAHEDLEARRTTGKLTLNPTI
ncbi:MAG TPA: zinc-binding dehydrogenase [Thermoleophilaceae bacterium]|nr:zinc-binding dehydrogenase [Thermoleophilaceae bacterium]